MTAQEIIEKIRAEVERRKKAIHSTLFNDEYNDFLRFLSDLEKEEKPMNPDEAMKKLDFEQELYKHFGQVKDFTLGMRIGQYFYELGCRRTAEKYDEIEYERQRASGSSEIPKDLEEAAKECNSNLQLQEYFIKGGIWQKKQMLKEAVPFYEILEAVPPGPERENVRIIIVKED